MSNIEDVLPGQHKKDNESNIYNIISWWIVNSKTFGYVTWFIDIYHYIYKTHQSIMVSEKLNC